MPQILFLSHEPNLSRQVRGMCFGMEASDLVHKGWWLRGVKPPGVEQQLTRRGREDSEHPLSSTDSSTVFHMINVSKNSQFT